MIVKRNDFRHYCHHRRIALRRILDLSDERHDGMKMACMFIFMTMMIFSFKTAILILFETRKTDIIGMIHPEAMVMMRDSGHQQHCQCRETHKYFGYPCPHFFSLQTSPKLQNKN